MCRASSTKKYTDGRKSVFDDAAPQHHRRGGEKQADTW